MPSAAGTFVEIDHVRYPPSVRCTATNKLGDRCGRMSTRGTTVCNHHGAAAPRVRKAAERAVQEALAEIKFASPKAVRKLIDLIDSEDEMVALRASDQILRRSLPDVTRMEIEASMKVTGEPASAIVRRRLAALSGRMAEIDADAADAELPEPPGPSETAERTPPRELGPAESTLSRYRRGEHPPAVPPDVLWGAPTIVDADPSGADDWHR